MGEGHAYSLRRICADASLQQLISTDVALPEPAEAVLEIRRTVLIDQTEVLRGHVLFSGRLRLTCTYAARCGGTVKALTLEPPFAADAAAPEAEPDMEVRLLEAHVTDAQAAILTLDLQGSITALRDHSVVRLTVLLLREEVVSLQARTFAPRVRGRVPQASAPAGPTLPPDPDAPVPLCTPAHTETLVRPFRFTRLPARRR